MSADLYNVLGVDKSATKSEIKKAYHNLAKKYHPDLNPGDDAAEERFKQITAAYDILGNDEKRQQYDAYGSTGGAGFGGNPFGGGGGDIFDILNSVFGGAAGGGFGGGFGGGGGGRSGARRGQDFQMGIEITFKEAADGGKRTIEVPTYDSCHTCSGSGAKPGTSPSTCTMCAGMGVVRQQQGFFSLQRDCPQCDGVGKVIKEKCPDCHGDGHVEVTSELEVDIPAGVNTGQRLRMVGKGGPGANGGPKGDLYIGIQLEDHALFEREDRNLICTVPISFTQAALGAKIDVPTLDGKVVMTIPAGTQNGKVFRLRGKGFPGLNSSSKGDQLVEIIVETPVNLNDRQKELLAEFAELSGDDVHPEKQSFFDRLKNIFD